MFCCSLGTPQDLRHPRCSGRHLKAASCLSTGPPVRKPGGLRCRLCGTTFRFQSWLVRHMASCSRKEESSEEEDGDSTEAEAEDEEDSAEDGDAEEGSGSGDAAEGDYIPTCRRCGLTFRTKQSLGWHTRRKNCKPVTSATVQKSRRGSSCHGNGDKGGKEQGVAAADLQEEDKGVASRREDSAEYIPTCQSCLRTFATKQSLGWHTRRNNCAPSKRVAAPRSESKPQ